MSPITLPKPGDQKPLLQSELTATLRWTAPVELDLIAFYQTQDDQIGVVYYAEQGNLDSFPHIALNDDFGTAQNSGEQKKKLCIANISTHHHIFLVGYSYNQPDSNFSRYGATLTLANADSPTLVIDLNATQVGQWYIIAQIDNHGLDQPQLINLSRVQTSHPNVRTLVKD